ncbi:MAG TPA: hypothetical protein VH416_06475 [Gaiellaceae bacterium]|jgi:hypothetical protein
MRRFLLLSALVAALAVPAAGLAFPDSVGDGTLAVRNAAGDNGQVVVWLNVSGAVVGQIDGGKILLDDLSATDGLAPVITGAERQRDLPSGATLYSGTDIRFRAIGGHYRIRILGHGIDVNVVGTGSARLTGSPFLTNDGRYSLDGGPWTSLPDFGKAFDIGT